MSLNSRAEIKAILEKKYYDVCITEVNSTEDLDKLIARKPDLVFLGMKFAPVSSNAVTGSDWSSQRLTEAGIPYTGSSQAASMLEYDKLLAKEKVSGLGLATAASLLLKQGEIYDKQEITLDYPIFIKPVVGGGSTGINDGSLVHNFDELEQQVRWLMGSFRSDALLESYLPGREFSVGVLQKIGSPDFHLLPIEIVAPLNKFGSRFLSSQIKRTEPHQTLEITDKQLKSSISTFALRIFKALGGQDYGRIDIRMDDNGLAHFLEANLQPSLLNNYGNLPRASLMNIGLTHDQLIFQIAELGLAKNIEQPSVIDNFSNLITGIKLQELLA